MHLTGMTSEPRHYAQLSSIPGPASYLLASTMPLQRHISASAVCLALAQLPFLIALLQLLRKPRESDTNPWDATTLEWAPDTLLNAQNSSASPRVYRMPCSYSLSDRTFSPQWNPVPISEHDTPPKAE